MSSHQSAIRVLLALMMFVVAKETSAQSPSGRDATKEPAQDLPSVTLSRKTSDPHPPFRGEKKRIAISGRITDVVQARRGRILALVLAAEKQIVIFDAAVQEIVKVIPLQSSKIAAAGTLDHLTVVDQDRSIIERWSLDTLKLEASKTLPSRNAVLSVTAGSASDGPLLFRHLVQKETKKVVVFSALDLHTFATIPLKVDLSDRVKSQQGQTIGALNCRASANGTFFTVWGPIKFPDGFAIVQLRNKSLSVDFVPLKCGYALPSEDDRLLFSGLKGVLEGKAFADKSPTEESDPCVPTSHPQFYLEIPGVYEPTISKKGSPERECPRIFEVGKTSPLLTLPQVRLESTKYDGGNRWTPNNFMFWLECRVFYYLPANLLIAVPYGDDCLDLYAFDLPEELAKAELDHLYVSSTPNQHFEPGKAYQYQIEVESNKKQSLRFELASGPSDMRVSPEGMVTWDVPANFDKTAAEIRVAVQSEANRQAQQAFTIYRAK